MRLRLVSHASVITTTPDAAVWCDPWLFGKAFNDSWSLFPEAAWDEAWLDEIDFLWISHEHPDHLHFPTLKSLPETWKARVTVLYQDRASEEVVGALRRLGFANVRLLPHRREVSLRPRTSVSCFHAPHGDSCLSIRGGDRVCVNVNDAQVTEADCREIRADLGHVDVVLKQFSLAGYTGGKDYASELPAMAESILIHMTDVHRWLDADVTVPFASFVYFSHRDNRFVNEFANSPRAAFERLGAAGARAVLLHPGDAWEVGEPFDPGASLARFDAAGEAFDELPFDDPPVVPLPELANAFETFAADIHDKFTEKRIGRVPPLHIRVPDLGETLAMSIRDRTLVSLGSAEMPAHLEVGSQALRFAFGARFGFETMSISSRVFVLDDVDWPWILNRDLLWIYRWGIWLKPKWLLSPANLRRVWPWFRENRLNRDYIESGARRWIGRLRERLGALRSRLSY